jgi:hypothetical protein
MKKIIALLVLISLVSTFSAFSFGAQASTDTIKYKTIKLPLGAEFSIPSDWEQIERADAAQFNRPQLTGTDLLSSITIVSNKSDKAKYKDLGDFIKKTEGKLFRDNSKGQNLKTQKIKTSYSSGDVIDTSCTKMLDFGGSGGVGKLETAYFKTKSGYYFGIQLLTMDCNMDSGVSKFDNVVSKLIATFKEIPAFDKKAESASSSKSARLFPVSSNGEFSYVDMSGKEILKTPYGFADDFIGGYAHIMNELGGMSGYIDIKGKQLSSSGVNKDVSKANLSFRGAREINGETVVDLSKKVKKYTSTQDGWKANNEDYTMGDGFEVRIWTASGAPNVKLYKNGKIICDKIKELQESDIFLIVKYDKEKIIRFLYADPSTGKLKTIYVDYNGNPIWTSAKDQAKPAATKATPHQVIDGVVIDNYLKPNSGYFYIGYGLDDTYLAKAKSSIQYLDAAILSAIGASLTENQKTEIVNNLNQGTELKSTSFHYTINNVKLLVSLYHNTDPNEKHLKDININVSMDN